MTSSSQLTATRQFDRHKTVGKIVGMFAPALFLFAVAPAVARSSDDLSREQLKPLTAFRQQHRRAVLRSAFQPFTLVAIHIVCQVDGRLCAAAFVQERGGGNDLQWRDVVQSEMGCTWLHDACLDLTSAFAHDFHACVERQVCVRKIVVTMLANIC